jgi:hypothetical protein
MNAAPRTPHLQPVAMADLPEYPIPRSERLPELAFIKWVPSQWLNSSGHAKCTYEVQGMARALFDISTAQSPIGTLPDDDEELAFLLRVPMPQFAALRALGARGPVRNWSRCVADGEVRLMHRVVTASLQDVLERRDNRNLSKEAQAEAKRFLRLAEGLQKIGVHADVCGDGILMKRLEDWLNANWRGNRTLRAYMQVIEVARKERWI